MMPKDIDIIVIDTESTGLLFNHHEIIEVAGKVYNGVTFEPYPPEEGGEFCSLMMPLYPERASQQAMDVHKHPMEKLLKAPHPKVVWPEFLAWVKRWAKKGGKWDAPIAAGKNIRAFDLPFMDVYHKAYSPKTKVVFNCRLQIDLEDDLQRWFGWNDELPSRGMDVVREYFGMTSEGAHTALVDVQQEGELIMRFQKLYKTLFNQKTSDGSRRIKLKGSFANAN